MPYSWLPGWADRGRPWRGADCAGYGAPPWHHERIAERPADSPATRDLDADARANERARQSRLAEDRARSPEERLQMTLSASVTLLRLAGAARADGSTRT